MDLQKAVRTPPPLTLERKVNIIVQTLAGLAHAHQAGIVHRDIKPANIFINQDGTVKIMDFGVARLTTASMTGTGNIVGTADYMSPEQVKGAKVDGRSDLFSVGCMLYELLAGRRPFHSDNLMAIFYKITHEEPNFDLIPEGAEYDALHARAQEVAGQDPRRPLPDRLRLRGGPARVPEGPRDLRLRRERARGAARSRGAVRTAAGAADGDARRAHPHHGRRAGSRRPR